VTMRMARGYAEPAGLAGRRDGAVLPLAVDLRGVRKSFGPVQAVRGVTLAVGSGEVLAFLGPNGAGKTSTIDMILGFLRPDAGAVEVYGMAPRQAVRKGLVSAVMQAGGLLKDLTVAETVRYTAGLFAVSRPVGEVLERAGTRPTEHGGDDRRLGMHYAEHAATMQRAAKNAGSHCPADPPGGAAPPGGMKMCAPRRPGRPQRSPKAARHQLRRRITGRMNVCREHARTITNAHTVTGLPAAGSS
jgi:energy-coupling factor transporter ATP-binding protein EcfA2